MTSLFARRSTYKKGTILVAFIVLIPTAMLLFSLLLTRIEASNRSVLHEQERLQARLLAESGLVALKDAFVRYPGSIPTGIIEGVVEGAGTYRITRLNSRTFAGAAYEIEGAVEGRGVRRTCSIRVAGSPGRWAVTGQKHRMESIAARPQ